MPPARQPSQPDAVRRQRRRLLCLLLALCLWRGPLPLCHLHADSAESTGLAGPSLTWHLQWFHPGTLSGSESFGWHWHFVLPGDADGDGQRDAESADLLSGLRSAPGLTPTESLQQLRTMSDLLVQGLVLAAGLARLDSTPSECQAQTWNADDPPQFRSGADVRLLAGVALC